MTKILKKSLACLLAFVLCFTAIASCLAVSAEAPTISVGSLDLYVERPSNPNHTNPEVCEGERIRLQLGMGDLVKGTTLGMSITMPEGLTTDDIDVAGWHASPAGIQIVSKYLDPETRIFTMIVNVTSDGDWNFFIRFNATANIPKDEVYSISAKIEAATTSAAGDDNIFTYTTNSRPMRVMTSHSVTEIGPAKDATCEEAGITAGSKCSRCEVVLEAQEEVEATGHNYVDGTCANCGNPDPDAVVGPQLYEEILIRDPDVTIDATLFIRLRVDKRTLPAGTASYEMVVIPTKYDVVDANNYYNEIVAEEIPLTLDSETSNYAIYYYKDAAMYELGLNIDAYVKCYDANGNYIYYSNRKSYIPSVGLTALFNGTNTSLADKKIVTDLLNMGAAAQEYNASLAQAKDSDAYNTVMAGNLVNAGLTTQEYAGTLGTVDTTNTTVKNPDATYKETVKPAFSLGVAPTASLQVYKASNLKDDFTLEVSYTSNRNAEKKSYTVTGNQWGTSGTKLVHYASGIAYYDGNAVITMKLYHNGVEVSTTTYTVEAGLSTLFGNADSKLVAFAKATAIFGATARARLG